MTKYQAIQDFTGVSQVSLLKGGKVNLTFIIRGANNVHTYMYHLNRLEFT
jgi:hypothetical protein